jgi:hypothetical protein
MAQLKPFRPNDCKKFLSYLLKLCNSHKENEKYSIA